MRILITGGTGFIGRHLVGRLKDAGHEPVVLSRNALKVKELFGDGVTAIGGNPAEPGDWQEEIGKVGGVVNFCGEPILAKKWNEQRKQLILNSRILPTRNLIDAIARAKNPPKVLVSGSAIGYYGDRGNDELTEEEPPGKDFGAYLCSEWEAEAGRAREYGVRVVTLRTGEVFGHGGVLEKMVKPFKFYMGGTLGSGRQYMSWIHMADHNGITIMALTNDAVTGPVNTTAPNPATNREVATAIGRALGKPSVIPTPNFTFKLLFGEGAALITGSHRVIPKKALANGYRFQFEKMEDALRDVLKEKGRG